MRAPRKCLFIHCRVGFCVARSGFCACFIALEKVLSVPTSFSVRHGTGFVFGVSGVYYALRGGKKLDHKEENVRSIGAWNMLFNARLFAVLVVLSDLFVGFVAYHQRALRFAMITLNGLFLRNLQKNLFFVVSLPNNFKIKNCENFCFDSLHWMLAYVRFIAPLPTPCWQDDANQPVTYPTCRKVNAASVDASFVYDHTLPVCLFICFVFLICTENASPLWLGEKGEGFGVGISMPFDFSCSSLEFCAIHIKGRYSILLFNWAFGRVLENPGTTSLLPSLSHKQFYSGKGWTPINIVTCKTASGSRANYFFMFYYHSSGTNRLTVQLTHSMERKHSAGLQQVGFWQRLSNACVWTLIKKTSVCRRRFELIWQRFCIVETARRHTRQLATRRIDIFRRSCDDNNACLHSLRHKDACLLLLNAGHDVMLVVRCSLDELGDTSVLMEVRDSYALMMHKELASVYWSQLLFTVINRQQWTDCLFLL